jgi:hypothetical protein
MFLRIGNKCMGQGDTFYNRRIEGGEENEY